MQELDNLIEKLNTDKYSAVSVFDLKADRWIFRNKSHQEIKNDFESAEDFFEDIFAKGHRNLNLTLKRKNGSTYKIDGEPFDVNFSTQNKPQAVEVQQAKPVQTHDVFSNSFGLGTLDVMNLMVAKNDASRLHTENEFLKSENKEIKKKYEDIREEQLASKYDVNKSKGTQEMLMGAIQQLPTLISFVKGVPAVGLSAPVETFESEVKQHFAMTLQHLDDTVVGVLNSINKGLNNNNEFSEELAQLLKKHHLWEA